MRADVAQLPARIAAALVPLFGVLVVARGHDADWDFRNYHWYNAYAFLTDRRQLDVAVAHHATYYNPLADVPVYVAAQHLPAWSVGFLIGVLHGTNLWLLYRLARAALAARPGTRDDWLALGLAVAGTTGGMALLLVGNASNDMTMSLFVLAALWWLVLAADRDLARLPLLAAGLAGGCAVGLKLTMAPFALGLAAGTLALRGSWLLRLQRVAMLAAGGIVSAALCGGVWAYTVWHDTGNPVFPYFNDLIGSPLLLHASYRDPRFLPHGIPEAIVYPLRFAWDGLRVNDVPFRDVKIALAYLIVPATVAFATVSGRPLTAAMRILFATAAVAYVAWLTVFGVYRYVVTLELLAPLLIALALQLWPIAARARIAVLIVLWSLALIGTGWSAIVSVGRPWGRDYVRIDVPPIADPRRTLAIVAGLEPVGYIVPEFPRGVAFLRIDGWLDSPESNTRFGERMRARIAAHEGPIYGVFIQRERQRALAAFAADGLVLAPHECATITSNVGDPLQWCALMRKSDGQ